MEYYKRPVLPASVIVLNSLTNLSGILPDLRHYDKISVFFDRDDSGRKALIKVIGVNANVADFSKLYEGHKDFNDYMVNTRTFERLSEDLI